MNRQQFIQQAFIALSSSSKSLNLTRAELTLLYTDACLMWDIHEAAEQARISGLPAKKPYTIPDDTTANDS